MTLNFYDPLFHFSDHSNELQFLKQWKGALNRIIPSLLGYLKNKSPEIRHHHPIYIYINQSCILLSDSPKLGKSRSFLQRKTHGGIQWFSTSELWKGERVRKLLTITCTYFWGHPRCNIIYYFPSFYGRLSGLGSLLRMFCLLCFMDYCHG